MDTTKHIFAKKVEITSCLYKACWSCFTKQLDDAIFQCKTCCKIAKEIGDKESEMTSYKTMALAYDSMNRYDDAILYSRKCLDLVLVNPEASDAEDSEMSAYFVLGSSHFKMKKYNDAIAYTTVCLNIAVESGEKPFVMRVSMMLGAAYLAVGQNENAILYEKRSIEIAKLVDDKYNEMHAQVYLSKAFSNLHKLDDTIFHGKECIAIAKKHGHKDVEIKARLIIGFAHYNFDLYDDAISYGTSCIEIAKEIGGKILEMHSCMLLAYACYMANHLNDAVAYGRRGLSIAEESNQKDAQMQEYSLLGIVYVSLLQRKDAIMCANKCLTIAQDTNNKLYEMDALYILGLTYFSLYENDVAISYFKNSRTIALEIGNKFTEELINTVLQAVNSFQEMYNNGLSRLNESHKNSEEIRNECLEGIFEVPIEDYYSSDDNEGLYHKEVGIKSLQSVFGKLNYNNPDNIKKYMEFSTDSLKSLYDICHALKDSSKNNYCSLGQYFPKLIHELICSKILYLEVITLKINAVIYMFLKQFDKALQSYQSLITISKKRYLRRLEIKSHFSVGSIYQMLGQTKEAEESYRQGIRCFEALLDILHKHDVLKISFVERFITYYKTLSDILIQTHQIEEAFLVLERCRAQVLKDVLAVNYGMKRDKTGEEHIHLSDIQSLVSTNDYTILFYSVCFKQLYTFVVEDENDLQFSCQVFEECETIDKAFREMNLRHPNECENRSLEATEDNEVEVDKDINCAQDESLLPERSVYDEPWREDDDSNLKNALRELHQKLLGKVMGLIKQEKIVIITDGPLSKVPFVALMDPKTGRYLSETKQIRFAPSITTLKFLQEGSADCYNKTGALIIGDPHVGRVMLNGMESYISSLKNARKEAEKLAKILGVKPLIGEEATKPVVIKKLQKGASIVHIAAHGILSQAAIVLAPSSESRSTKKLPDEEDYILTTADVQKAQVRAQLVVLSCCHSGRGKIRAEGVVGMCRAFLASGARAVVASLWAIEDTATLTFMTWFYSYLKEGKSASKSLQMTMNEMRNSEEYNKPMYWAPFILMGDDVTIDIFSQW